MTMLKVYIVLLPFVLFVNTIENALTGISTGPSNTEADVGDTVVLTCDPDYLGSNDNVVWFHSSSGTKISENELVILSNIGLSTKSERYSIITRSSNFGNIIYNLRITEFADEDAGFYSCVIVNSDEIIDSASALLTINPPGSGKMTPPRSSVMCNTSIRDPEIDDDITVTCQCEGGDPVPILNLLIGETPENELITVTKDEVHSLSKTITLDHTFIGVPFKCKLVSAALNAPVFCSIIPLPVVVIVPSQPSVTETEDLSLSCRARGISNPSFEWVFHESCGTNLLENNTHTDIIRISNVTMSLNGCKVTCDVKSVSSATTTILVKAKTPTTSASFTPYNNNNNNKHTDLSGTSMTTVIVIVCCSAILTILLASTILILKRKKQRIVIIQKTPICDNVNLYEETRKEENEEVIDNERSFTDPTEQTQCRTNEINERDLKSLINGEEVAAYENVSLDLNNDTQSKNTDTSGQLNYVELDLTNQTFTVIHSSAQPTNYSEVIVP